MTHSFQPRSSSTTTAGYWLLTISGCLLLLCLTLAPRAINDWQTSKLSAAELGPTTGISVVRGTITVVTTRTRSLCLKVDDLGRAICPAALPRNAAAMSLVGRRATGYYKADSNRLLSLQLDPGQEIVSISAVQSNLKKPLRSLSILAALAVSGLVGAALLIALDKAALS